MKLLNSFVSPFAARPRLAIYAKSLPVEIAPANMWLPDYRKAPDYLALNPIGKIPTLVLDDGSALPESKVIVEYLADAFPASGLRPTDARDAARARLLAHLAELYVQIPASPLFGQLFASDRDGDAVKRAIQQMDEGFGHIEHFLSADAYAVGDSLTLADCALAPFIFFFGERMFETFSAPSPLGKRPKLAGYWERIRQDKAVARVLTEMRDAMRDSRLKVLLPPVS